MFPSHLVMIIVFLAPVVCALALMVLETTRHDVAGKRFNHEPRTSAATEVTSISPRRGSAAAEERPAA